LKEFAMLTLISRSYRRLAAAVMVVAVVTLGLYVMEPWRLGGTRSETYLADPNAPIVAMLPEVEVVAKPIEWR
jgi:hypothetical protein